MRRRFLGGGHSECTRSREGEEEDGDGEDETGDADAEGDEVMGEVASEKGKKKTERTVSVKTEDVDMRDT